MTCIDKILNFLFPKEPLYVITTIFNPSKTRLNLYKKFKEHILKKNVKLFTIVATNDENLRIERTSSREFIFYVQTDCHIWLKENLLNYGITKLTNAYPDWEYVALIDADIEFINPNWDRDTITALLTYKAVQMFSHITQLNKDYQPLNSFALSYMEGRSRELHKKPCPDDKKYSWCGAPGGAWAYTRDCMDAIYPLLDIGIVGSGDLHMVTALLNEASTSFMPDYTEEYKNYILNWQKKVQPYIKCNVGHVKGLILHYWHGSLKNRNYETRWKLLGKHKFNPMKDLTMDKNGLYSITPTKPYLIKDIKDYFKSRKEDE